jgi:hypothetical protein
MRKSLLAQSAAQLKVTQAPPGSFDDVPPVPLGSLMRFNASKPLNHRIKLIVTVALRQQNGDICLAGEDSGILVRSAPAGRCAAERAAWYLLCERKRCRPERSGSASLRLPSRKLGTSPEFGWTGYCDAPLT